MSTDLVPVCTSSYLALSADSDTAVALKANMAAGETLDASVFSRVKTPSGGGTTWVIPGTAGDEETKVVQGIVVGLFARGVLWPHDEVAEGTLPVLVTDDLMRARVVGDIPPNMAEEISRCRLADGSVDWAKLSYTQFGSGKGGIGKRAKEQRVIFVLREQDTFPLVITAQPGSLKTVRPFFLKLPVPHWRAVASFTLNKVTSRGGQPYAQIIPRLVGQLSKEEGEIVRETWTNLLKKIATSVALDADAEGHDED